VLLTQVTAVLTSACFMYMAYSEKEISHVGTHYPYFYFFDFALMHEISVSEKQALGGGINTTIACIILF